MDFNRLKGTRLKGKTVIVRVDFNVPRNKDGSISDDTRLQAALPTIKHLQKSGAKTILLSHFGRPKGKPDEALSLRFIVPALAEALDSEVMFSPNLNTQVVTVLEPGGVMLMENTRFHKGETEGDKELAQEFAALGDIFIQDAFSAAHRNHASSAVIGEILPSFAGLAMERELDHISQALINPKSPVMGVVGGAKVSTKIDLLKNLVSKLDILAIGGGMANTFLYAQGHKVGASLCETDFKDTALEIMKNAKKEKCKIILPTDVVVAKDFKANADHRQCGLDDVKAKEMILDCGSASVEELMDAMDAAKTLIWNGPLGAFELTPFDTSTVEAAKYAAKLTKKGKLVSVAGGGDTVAALKHAGAADDFTFISTAGGAFLEWMEGKPLPGVEILKKKQK
ncbi:phosphoglycerate kinase [Hellea balneolensis]|uniref:phosphoglycerate kinase n=1 Tax=Hellea balneolensis TaxID=287478 RepID=UPI000414A6BC|nr:phosphoglycerate kinase [Hellea balneolensis]